MMTMLGRVATIASYNRYNVMTRISSIHAEELLILPSYISALSIMESSIVSSRPFSTRVDIDFYKRQGPGRTPSSSDNYGEKGNKSMSVKELKNMKWRERNSRPDRSRTTKSPTRRTWTGSKLKADGNNALRKLIDPQPKRQGFRKNADSYVKGNATTLSVDHENRRFRSRTSDNNGFKAKENPRSFDSRRQQHPQRFNRTSTDPDQRQFRSEKSDGRFKTRDRHSVGTQQPPTGKRFVRYSSADPEPQQFRTRTPASGFKGKDIVPSAGGGDYQQKMQKRSEYGEQKSIYQSKNRSDSSKSSSRPSDRRDTSPAAVSMTSSKGRMKPDMIRRSTENAEGNEVIRESQLASTNASDPEPKKRELRVERRRKQYLFPPEHLDVFITCHPGLESILSMECTDLGIIHSKGRGGVQLGRDGADHLSTKMDDILKCQLYLGTASKMSIRCGSLFPSRALGELQRRVENIPWNQILQPEDRDKLRFKLKVSAAKSRLMHSTAIRDKVLAGIYASLGLVMPEVDEKEEVADPATSSSDQIEIPLDVHVFRDLVQISILTSPTPLHQRMYKLETGKAPLREDIAYAFLYSAGWKPAYDKGKASVPREYTSLLDPFCGSGSIPIEAAAMATGLPPGRLLPPPLQGTSLYDPKRWEKMVLDSMKKSANVDTSNIQVLASDRNQGVIKSILSNAKRAGVSDMIQVQQCAFSANPWLDDPSLMPDQCLIASNLPFGRRTRSTSRKEKDDKELLPIYQKLATAVNASKSVERNVHAMLLTDNQGLVQRSGFDDEVKTVLTTNHGGIPVFAMNVK